MAPSFYTEGEAIHVGSVGWPGVDRKALDKSATSPPFQEQ